MSYARIPIIAVLMLLMIPLVLSEESFIFKQNSNSDLELPVFENDMTKCTTCLCTISINYPNGSNVIRSSSVTINGHYAIFNLNRTTTSEIGVYQVDIHCNNGADNGASTFEYLVTVTGNELETSESIIYIIFIVGLIFTFLFFIFGAIKIPFKNTRADNGQIVSVNDLKYLKVVCIVFSYLILMAIFGILRQITANYLFLNQAHKTFQWLYWFLLSFTLPIIIVSVILMIVMFFENKKIKKALFRGVPIR